MENMGLLTAAVAGIFTIIGIIVGFFLCKTSLKPVKLEAPKEKVNVGKDIERLIDSLENLRNSLKAMTSEKLDSIRASFESILSSISELKTPLKEAGVTKDSMQRIDKMVSDIQSMLKVPASISTDVFTKFQDNLSIIRNDLQAIKLNQTKKTDLREAMRDLSSSIDIAREINRACVASELISMVDSIKEPDKKKLTEALDRISLNSKELVLKLKALKSDLEGVKR